jgi:hypothetical protein
MAVRVAVDASAAQDAGRSAAILEMHQGEVRDYPSATAEPGRLFLPTHQDVLEPCWVPPQPRDEWQRAAYPTALLVEPAQPVVSLLALL